VKYIEGGQYPVEYLLINVPLYIIIWILSIYISGGYDKTTNISKIIRGLFWGTVIIAAVYGFLPEQYRFSRGMIIAGAALNTFLLIISRSLIHFIKHRNFRFGEEPDKKILIIGNREESKRAHQLLNQLQLGNQIVGYVHTNEQKINSDLDLGDITVLKELIAVYKANELIFCAKDISSQQIINWMVMLGQQIDFKIIPDQSFSIIGSNSKNTAGDIYTVDIQLKIALPEQKRNKRIFDLSFAAGCLLSLPVSIFFVQNKIGFIKNIFRVLSNKKTWVGYVRMEVSPSGTDMNQLNQTALPVLKTGILQPLNHVKQPLLDQQMATRINFIYARDYRVTSDMEIVMSGFSQLGDSDQ
ncbi:MAG: nucleoside-diphosphate sugar epimerase/dehydratase, partial [Chitinophagales bacterium]